MTTRVLIAGGGVAALEATLALRELCGDAVVVEIVSPEPRFWYRPTSVAEPFGLGKAAHFDLATLTAAAGATFSPGAIVGVEASRRIARVSTGAEIEYDALLLACGAVPTEAVPGALTFRGPADRDKIVELLGEIAAGRVNRVAFAVPWGAAWSLPIYELALMTAAHADALGRADVELALVTPEDEPLHLFGSAASAAVRRLLDERRVELRTGACAVEFVAGELRLLLADSVAADRVVALPRLRGPRIDGLLQTSDGFVPTDEHGRVRGLSGVFAAGDVTTFPVKQGGIAAQQADAAALAIAASAGVAVTPEPFRPILRGLLLNGSGPQYLRNELAGGRGDASRTSEEPLWWPPAKIVGRYLAPFLAELSGIVAERPLVDDALEVDIALDATTIAAGPPIELYDKPVDDEGRVGGAMSADPLVVAPEETLGEVAEKMRPIDAGSAIVGDGGRVIGILTSRDLLRAFAARAHPSEARVHEWMTAEPVTVSVDTPLAVALTLMTEHGFHHLPVVERERPVGLLGLRQAARRLSSQPRIGLGF